MSIFFQKRSIFYCSAVLGIVGFSGHATAGSYSGPTDTAHPVDPAIAAGDGRFVEWADAIDASRTAFAPRGSTSISTTGFNSLGDLDATEIANGDAPGFLTVTFPTGIRDGAGADFAVFENGFGFGGPTSLFAELAFVLRDRIERAQAVLSRRAARARPGTVEISAATCWRFLCPGSFIIPPLPEPKAHCKQRRSARLRLGNSPVTRFA